MKGTINKFNPKALEIALPRTVSELQKRGGKPPPPKK